MDTNHGAAGDPPDDDVFGPIEDGEEVFEWIDDQDGADDGAGQAGRAPAPTLRERIAAVRSGGRRLRRSRREIAAVAAVIIVACTIGGGGTAWFDGVAGAADRAEVVSLAVDSVVDGDPANGSYDAKSSSAVGEYVVEVANNSPDAVTLDSVDVDAGTKMTSTAWKPVGGSARIPGGGTLKVALTVRMFCPMVMMSEQMGMLGAALGGSASSLAFPAVHVEARDGDDDLHSLVLPTRVTVSSELPSGSGQLTFLNSGTLSIPQIVSADAGACAQFTTDHDAQREVLGDTARFTSDIAFAYDKVLSPASAGTFVLGFTVKNTSDHADILTKRTDVGFVDDVQLHTDWLPARIELAPGASAQAQLKIDIHNCTSVLSGAPVLGETMLEVDDPRGGDPQPVFIDQALSGSLRLAGDIVQQEKAACG